MQFWHLPKNFFVLYTTHYVATQQFNLKENTMFDFTKQTKQFEELAQRIKEVNEFWINSVISSLKQFTK